MKSFIAFLAIVAVVTAIPVPDFNDDAACTAAFEQFQKEFNRNYLSHHELLTAYSAFRTNMKTITELNGREPEGSSPFGINKFADIHQMDFAAQYLNKFENHPQPTEFSNVWKADKSVETLPASFNWVTHTPSVVTAVKNQGQCGSCWTFSAVEALESVCAIAGYPLQVLSEQQIVDCDTGGDGCGGGLPWQAFTYLEQAGGIETEADYPYTAANGQCTVNKKDFVKCEVSSWKWVSHNMTSLSEESMATALVTESPLSIGADAQSWQFYTSGVIMATQCGNQLDHGIAIEGFGNQTVSGKVVDTWLVRNSWGADWGDNGYLYLQRGTNTCGCAESVSIPCVTDPSGTTTC